MFMYSAYMVLVVSFVLVIVLHAWFVRRLTRYHERAHAVKEDSDRLHAEVAELAETVDELSRGKDSNATTLQVLEREIEEIQEKIRSFLEEHPDLKPEFGAADKGVAIEKDGDPSAMEESGEPREEEAGEAERPDTAGDAARKD